MRIIGIIEEANKQTEGSKMQITQENIDGKTYYSAESKRVAYTLTFNEGYGEWELHSKRLSLGKMNTGTYRFFRQCFLV